MGLLIADRILKLYFVQNPAAKISGDFVFGLLNFNLVKNSGLAFGLAFFQPVLIVIIFLIILILIWHLVKFYWQKDFWLVLSFTLIIAGAVSNLLDRIRFGYVIDYFDVPWFSVFNLADCLITVGVGIFIINVFFASQLDKKEKLL